VASDTQLWRQKLDSYKSTIEDREETIAKLKYRSNKKKSFFQNIFLEKKSLVYKIKNKQVNIYLNISKTIISFFL